MRRIMLHDAKILRLGHTAEIAAGYPLRTAADALDPGNVPFIQLRNVDPIEGIDWPSVTKVSLPSKREPQWLTSGGIIFAARGSRNFAYALDGVPHQTVCAPQFFVITPRDQGAIDPAFLAWQINQRPAQEYIAQTATGSAMLNIRRKALEALPIVLPPIEQQRQIAELHRVAREERALLARLMKNRDKQMEALAWGLLETAKGARA
jgi:hypothetical protein